MFEYNLHTHTYRCQHASGTDREYVENAIQAGLKVLGFSDHVPYPFESNFVSPMRMPVSQLDDYVDSLSRLRKEYADDIQILIGFEAEYFPALFEKLLTLLKDYPIDYMIMGQHFIDTELPENGMGGPFTDADRLERFISQVIEGLSTCAFSSLAHPDMPYFTGDFAVYRQQMLRLCEFMKANQLPLEINGLGLMNGRNYPNPDFIALAKEAGCDFVVGFDFHEPEAIIDPNYINTVRRFVKTNGVSPVPLEHFYKQRL